MSNSRGATVQIIHVVSIDEDGVAALHVSEKGGYTSLKSSYPAGDGFWGDVNLYFSNAFAKALGEALIKASSGE